MRIGILGLAHAHVVTYAQQWLANPAWDVKPVLAWDHDSARLTRQTQSLKIAAADSSQQLVDSPEIDAVIIGSETAYHADHVELAARAGKAIILQKPLALTLDQGQRIVKVIEQTGVPFTLAWQMRTDPQNLQMKQMVDEGVLGRVFMVRRRHGLPTQAWPWLASSWHASRELNRGMWADDACHAADFLLWLLGEPVSVMAQVATLHSPQVPDDQGAAIFRYADGTLAIVESSFTCLAAENTTEIIGEKGSIIQNYGDVPSCNHPREAVPSGLKWHLQGTPGWTYSDIPSPASHGQRIAGLAQPLAEFLHGRRPAIATAQEGLQALRMIAASYESSQTGRLVELASLSS